MNRKMMLIWWQDIVDGGGVVNRAFWRIRRCRSRWLRTGEPGGQVDGWMNKTAGCF